MKFSNLIFLIVPLLAAADDDWTYKKGDKVNRGGGSTKCNNDKLNQGTDWAWDNKKGGCKLFMYGDTQCTGKNGLNFQTRGDKDHGHAQTDHLAWQVKC